MNANLEKATFAAGCFWGVESFFRAIPGVADAIVGYTGGRTVNPSYEDVCTGRTGHAEAVEVTYDPSRVSFGTLMQVFFDNHDPTTPNRQGPDVGSQYRSAIFFHSPEQKAIALAVIEELTRDKVFHDPIVTEVAAFEAFYPADFKHQGYYRANSDQPYCRAVITPKVTKLRQKYAAKLKTADRPS